MSKQFTTKQSGEGVKIVKATRTGAVGGAKKNVDAVECAMKNVETVGGAKKNVEPDRGATKNVETEKGEKTVNEDKDEREKMNHTYDINNAIIVNVGSHDIEEDDILDAIEDICGDDTVMACVPCGKNIYEISMINTDCKNILLPRFNIGEVSVNASSVNETSTVVSIMHMPPYVTDATIAEKMESYNIQIVSPIFRKFRIRKKRNRTRKVADGTRYFRVKFPKGVKSLPWSLSFHIEGVNRYFKTIHDNQMQVCFKCCSPDHMARDCSLNKCYSCLEFGHISKYCPDKYCSECDERWTDCECSTDTDDEAEEDTDNEERKDEANSPKNGKKTDTKKSAGGDTIRDTTKSDKRKVEETTTDCEKRNEKNDNNEPKDVKKIKTKDDDLEARKADKMEIEDTIIPPRRSKMKFTPNLDCERKTGKNNKGQQQK